MKSKSHWEHIYRDQPSTQVSWYQPHALRSLDLIRRVSPPPNGAHDLTALDLSATALAEARACRHAGSHRPMD